MSLIAERFAEAVHALLSDGPIKQRLLAAYSLNLEGLSESELPAGVRRDFDDLQAAMCRVAPAGSESRVRASVQKMSSAEAVGHAATILKLYVALTTGLERAEPLKVVVPQRKAPRFLTGS